MIWFLLGAALLLAATLAFVLRPLLRDPPARGGSGAAAVTTAVVKDQFDELERDHASGAIADREYEEAKLELKRRLLEDVGTGGQSAAARREPWAAVIVAAGVPIVAFALYVILGSPAALNTPPQAPSQPQARVGPKEIEAMVQGLAQRLQQKPDDLQGWVMLARSYKVLRRYPESVAAYRKAESIVLSDPRLLVDYAEVTALAQGGNLQGKPAELVAKALALDPNHPPALMLAGAVAYQRAEYSGATQYWEKARAAVPADSELAQALDQSIAKARDLAAGAKSAAGGKK